LTPRHLVSLVERWFRKHQRPLPWRENYEPYRVWVSEVMAQQTRIDVVLAYFARFVERFPTVEALAAASDDDVTAAWSGLGYYRRARMLRAGAIAVRERFGGRLPRGVNELQTIPGVGRYTAGAIASIAYGQREAIVDGNVARVLARLFAIDAPLASPALMRGAWERATALVALSKSPRDFNQGLMEIGALICTPRKPACTRCPLRADCAALAAGRTEELPRAKAKTVTREMTISLYVVTNRGRVMMQREKGELMRDMFHLPHGDTSLLTGKPLRIRGAKLVGSFRHTVTTRRITFNVFRVGAPASGARPGAGAPTHWVRPIDLRNIPHPSYVRKALQLAGICK
jgi:A/G-specific adenine glycosylase